MKPENLTVFGLFERQLRYVVPLFQRQYVWSKEDQWVPLWDNITTKANDVLDKGEYYYELHRHFMGAIVLSTIRPMGYQVPIMTVVDGQQRITTLQIIQIALRHYARAVEHQGLVDNLSILTENRLSTMQAVERYKIWPTNADQPIYESIFSATSPQALSAKYPPKLSKRGKLIEGPPKLVEAYLYFYEQIDRYANDRQEDNNSTSPAIPKETVFFRLDALFKALVQLMDVVTIDLDEKDNPQVIFESLNDRGVQLAPSDLIRNFVFLEAARQKAKDEYLYNTYWFEFDKPAGDGTTGFWKQVESQGRKKYIRLDQFIYHYLSYQRASDVLITRIYREFQKWWDEPETPRSIEAELKQLQHFSRVFACFYGTDDTSRLGIFFNRLRTLQTSTLYPLLLYLVGEKGDQLGVTELEGIATDLESYLVRRQACNLPTKNYNRFFLSILANLKTLSNIDRKAIQKLLLEPTGIANRWPADEEFKSAWLSQPAYQNSYYRAEMILRALDRQMVTEKREEVRVLSKLTVEHLLPQGWKEADYPLPEDPNRSHDQSLAYRAGLIHTFGNLTLLTSSLNSSISNGPFKVKRPAIALQSALQLNVYFQDESETWDEDKILKRGESLFKYALQVWPYPGNTK